MATTKRTDMESRSKPLSEFLRSLEACTDAVQWAEPYGLDYERAWQECQRGDWMFWMCRHFEISDATLRLIACDCARESLPIYESAHPGDMRPRTAIETAERYARGEATSEELDAAWAAARDAAKAAERAAAWAAAWASARYAERDAAWYAARARQADIVRARVTGTINLKCKE